VVRGSIIRTHLSRHQIKGEIILDQVFVCRVEDGHEEEGAHLFDALHVHVLGNVGDLDVEDEWVSLMYDIPGMRLTFDVNMGWSEAK
jgi:hypothetical protein